MMAVFLYVFVNRRVKESQEQMVFLKFQERMSLHNKKLSHLYKFKSQLLFVLTTKFKMRCHLNGCLTIGVLLKLLKSIEASV